MGFFFVIPTKHHHCVKFSICSVIQCFLLTLLALCPLFSQNFCFSHDRQFSCVPCLDAVLIPHLCPSVLLRAAEDDCVRGMKARLQCCLQSLCFSRCVNAVEVFVCWVYTYLCLFCPTLALNATEKIPF